MKKLLGGIFTRAQTSAASPSSSTAPTSTYIDTAPTCATKWGSFLPQTTPTQPIPAADPVKLQQLDALLRGAVVQIKAAIARILEGEECSNELRAFGHLVEQATDELQGQSCDLSLEMLKRYFSAPMGVAFCEQTAFPSLVLDFVGKMRKLAVKEELSRIAQNQDDVKLHGAELDESSSSGESTLSDGVVCFASQLTPLQFLMSCVIAVASNATLMDTFRCELPNLIELTAEEYPSMAAFIRDCCYRALVSVPDRSFNAGLAWYLLDCNVVAKVIRLLTIYSLATPTSTPDKAACALKQYVMNKPTDFETRDGECGMDSNNSAAVAAAAAAVSEALGFTRSKAGANEREVNDPTGSPLSAPPPRNLAGEEDAGATEIFCLPAYDVRLGLKSVIYVLEKTHRFTLALLDDFQATGGYVLILRLLDTCIEEDIPSLLDMLTHLIPLGANSSDCGGLDRGTHGARNVHAFVAIRDLLLNYVIEPHKTLESDVKPSAVAQSRNEHLILQLLTHVLQVYTSDYGNFAFLEPKTRTLALLLTKLPGIAFYDTQVIILRIVEYVCCAAKPDDPLPYEILAIVCGLLVEYGPLGSGTGSEDTSSTNSKDTIEMLLACFVPNPRLTLSTLLCECLIKFLQSCDTVTPKKQLSGFGVLDRGIYVWFVQIATCLATSDAIAKNNLVEILKPHIENYAKMVCLMLRSNYQECVQFRQKRIHESLYIIAETIISCDILSTSDSLPEKTHLSESSFSVMAVFVQLAVELRSKCVSSRGTDLTSGNLLLQNGVESDLRTILELLQQFRGTIWRQNLLLQVLMAMLKAGGPLLSSSWKSCQGYEILVALLSALDFMTTDSSEREFKMMNLILEILNVTLDSQHGGKKNSEYFKSILGYSTITSCIISSGVLNSGKREAVLQRVFGLIAGNNSQKEIYNGDAVQVIFEVLPQLSAADGSDTMTKLLVMLDNAGTNTIPMKEQVGRLVRAGAIQWMHNPKIISMISQGNHPLKPLLIKWLVILGTEEDLSIPCLQVYLELIGKMMPMLLSGDRCLNLNNGMTEDKDNTEQPEIGLQLLQSAVSSPTIRHVSVGKPHSAGLTGRYVHIVNSADRVWPPSSGYSFCCWMRFPAGSTSTGVHNSKCDPLVQPGVSMPSCKGFIAVTPDDNCSAQIGVYGVLVGGNLTLFPSMECAADNTDAVDELKIVAVTRRGPLECSLHTNSKNFRAYCTDIDDMEMWWRAFEHCGCDELVDSKITDSDLALSDDLLASFGTTANSNAGRIKPAGDGEMSITEEGSACILSVYSLEASGSFVRVFFEQSTGLLRFHTGTAASGSSIKSQRTAVVFEDIAIDDLRPAAASNGEDSVGGDCNILALGQLEQKRDWHHFAFTHRKAVMGSSLITVYIDGLEVGTKKLYYPSVSTAGSFQAYVGSDTQVCSPQSALSWKIGPAWLTDEVMLSGTIASIFSLGPTYTHQFSGHSYRLVGSWSEALASSHLARAADRGIEIAQFAQRLSLSRLERSCQPQWCHCNDQSSGNNIQGTNNESVAVSAALIAESVIAKKDELAEGLRLATGGGVGARKHKNKVSGFRNFINYDCALSSFGAEIESLLGNCTVHEGSVLLSLNTTSSEQSRTPATAYTQVHYINCAQSDRLDLARSLPSVGGISQILLPLLDNARRKCDFHIIIQMLVSVLRRNPSCLAEGIEINIHTLVASILCSRAHLINEGVLTFVVQLAVAGKLAPYATPHVGSTIATRLAHPVVVDSVALSQVVLSCELRKKLPHHLQCQLMSLLMDLLVSANPNALFNARQLRRAGIFRWIITYLSELGNEKCEMDQATALEMRWCFPKFSEPTFDAILQFALSLLRAFIRVESHVDDFYAIAEIMLLSMSSDSMHARRSPIRLILLQFVLHEIENDAPFGENKHGREATTCASSTIIEAILHRETTNSATKKREEKHKDYGSSLETASLGSPSAETEKPSSKFGKRNTPICPAENFGGILLEVIDQNDTRSDWVSVEALLSIRVLLSLAQMDSMLAEYLLSGTMLQKLKQVILKYSTDCSVYTPLLAYVSSVLVRDTNYNDLDTLSTTEADSQLLSSSSSSSKVLPSTKCIDQVWDLIGDLVLRNCQLVNNKIATNINVIVLGTIAFQVRTSLSFFGMVCNSSGTLFRIIVQCLLCCQDENVSENPSECTSSKEDTFGVPGLLQAMSTIKPEASTSSDAFVNLTHAIMSRSLSESEEFSSLIMHFLDCLDDGINHQSWKRSVFSRVYGQEVWFTFVRHVIENQAAMTDKCTLISLKNVCTMCLALSRYLADEANHHNLGRATTAPSLVTQEDDVSIASALPSITVDSGAQRDCCFGMAVYAYLLQCCEMCSASRVELTIGADLQQFFYGLLVFCAQTIMLNELGGAHRDVTPSPKLLDTLIASKDILLQRPSWQDLISCGVLTLPGDTAGGGDANSGNGTSGRPTRRMNRIRSLSANTHKELGVGTESDRSFIFCLVSRLFQMLTDDSEKVRHTAIVMWQFLINQRFDVLKELLIAEPRAGLLHSISTSKKEAIVDVFHDGFDRLLFVTETGIPGNTTTSEMPLNQEIWCQFQLWLTDNIALLADLIVARTDTIYQHLMDSLMACVRLQSICSTSESRAICLDLNFPIRIDIRNESGSDDLLPGNGECDQRDIIVKKALMKFSSFQAGAVESMSDALSRWRETSLRLAYTRNIWRTGRWQTLETCGANREPSTSTLEFNSRRSIFQRNGHRYRLDTTEGPQRMRIRLVREYLIEHKLEVNPADIADSSESLAHVIQDDGICPQDKPKSPYPDNSSQVGPITNELFRRSLEFHDAVEVFQEVVYLRATVSSRLGCDTQVFQNILSRCKMDSTRDLFSELAESRNDEGSIGANEIVGMARRIYHFFLDDVDSSGTKRILGISPSILLEIDRLISSATENSETYPLSSSMFDAADAEATQYALYKARSASTQVSSSQEATADLEKDESDDDVDDETSTGSVVPVNEGESDDSEGEEGTGISDLTLATKASKTEESDALKSPAHQPPSPKSELARSNKQIDTSSDAIYGAIARFIQRDDYPPIRSYNATYIAGMDKTRGLFIVSRSGLYFIGGYTKMSHNIGINTENDMGNGSSDITSAAASDSSPGGVSSQSGKTTDTPKEGKRKATKGMFRTALADLSMQFTQPKGSGEQNFTVVPLTEIPFAAQGGIQSAVSQSPPSLSFTSTTGSRWVLKYLNIKQFCRIKYQLRPVAIEFFDTSGSTYFLQMESFVEREDLVKMLFQMPLVNNIFWTPFLRTGSLVPSVKRIRNTLTKRWLRGLISNFEYLIHLNTLAGRSFNDLTQYPVFPWIIADYTSEFLNLEAHDTFRDLSKPMGAIGENRAAQFRERYAAMNQDLDVDGPMGSPAFHYGTHYSCSAYVVNYLIRLEPFTTLALELQGGEFDHPDRLFRSIPASWVSASRDNLQDVRELIPEFFYLPEFLFNANNCAFGTTQSGEDVCHVVLPPWAHGDTREFVRLHRQALESQYVSEHLHEWIDLVFGAKQTGRAAVEAQNVFMHITYEGTVDIEQITDPVLRAATLSQIENFGQTPSRLFSSPHPQRKVPTLLSTQVAAAVNAEPKSQPLSPGGGHQYEGNTLSSIEAFVKWHTPVAPALVSIGKDYVFLKKHSTTTTQLRGGEVGDVKLVNDKVQCQAAGCIFVPPRFVKYLDWGNGGGVMKLRVHHQTTGTGRYREANKVLGVIEGAHHDLVNCAALSDDGRLLITGGEDAVVNLIECSKAPDGRRVFKQMAKLVGHNDAVLCVAVNKEFNLIASSSADCSVLLWDLRTRALLQELVGHVAAVAHVCINGANGNVLTTTTSELRLWSINGDLLAASSSSAVGLQSITCAISTRCEAWQNGVVAVTGHANGTIALWGLRYPADLAYLKKEFEDAEAAAKLNPLQPGSSPSSPRRIDPINTAALISSQDAPVSARKVVVPSCQLFVMKLLLDHRVRVTALTLGPEQRQLLSGDAEGNCIRWVDDSISTNIH